MGAIARARRLHSRGCDRRGIVTEDRLLAAELRAFEQHRKEWLRSHAGEFAVIGATTVAGFYPSYETAFSAGLKNFGAKDFLIKQIWGEDPVFFIY
jgi:hypothetical protein